jgi:hypothetical protein
MKLKGEIVQIIKLKNGYSNSKLTEIVYSFKSLSFYEQVLLHWHLALFIGLDKGFSDKQIKKENIKFLSKETGHKVQEILPSNLR